MTCDDFQEDASRFMDRMLDASGQVRLFAHLSSCSDCRAFLASSVRVRELISKDPSSLPAGIDKEFFEQLSSRHSLREATPNRPQPIWRREVVLSFPLAIAATLLVILTSVLFSLQFAKTSAGSSTLQTVLDRTQAGPGKQTVVVVYQLPEEQVVTAPPPKIFEVRARTVAD
jgi:hypothetical protein